MVLLWFDWFQIILVLLIVLWILYPYFLFWNHLYFMNYYATEHTFYDPFKSTKVPFPSLHERGSVELSVVIPAYNEEHRITAMLDECMSYLVTRALRDKHFSYEVIVVDDGSTDRTAKVVADKYVRKYGADYIRLCRLCFNRGKGGAVRHGVFRARGLSILMVDADGATKFEEVEKLEAILRQTQRNGFGIVVGSRVHNRSLIRSKSSIGVNGTRRSFGEKRLSTQKSAGELLRRFFNLFVSITCVSGVQDTLCGFKLFSRRAAQTIFPSLHLQSWGFDVELLYIARRFFIPITEASVNYIDIPGSKVQFSNFVEMFRDILLLRFSYATFLWHLESEGTDLNSIR